jgi:hypothetical protein
MQNKIIYIPQNLDLEVITRVNPPIFEFDYEYAYILLYDIIKDSNSKLHKIKDWSNFYRYKSVKKYMVRRNSIELQNNRRDYSNYLSYLYQNNIIWREGYSEKVCRNYQLAPEYFGEPVKFIKILKSKNLKLLKVKDDATGKYSPLNKWCDGKLTIDTESASESLNSALNSKSNYYDYIKNCQLIVNINNGVFNFSRKEYSDDRLHSSFTRFPKTLRKYLRYDNQVLGEVDVSASVPFFMYYHLLAIVDSSKINMEVYEAFLKKPRFYQSAFDITKRMVELNPLEVDKFGSEILKGEYYNQFIPFFDDEYYISVANHELKRNYNYSDEDKLQIIKKRMLSWVNAREKHYLPEQAVFKKLYPTIYNFISVFKKRRYLPREGAVRKKAEKMVEKQKDKFTEKFQQHKKISHLFLQSESYIMLDNIARKLNKSRSKIPFFTLHDCIVTTKDNILELEQFMKDTFTAVIGFSPNFKSKIFE